MFDPESSGCSAGRGRGGGVAVKEQQKSELVARDPGLLGGAG